ncbi:carboxypeptidase-like regulatory domain-containing protein [Flavobacteriaceae bacterium S356]|uniref:Carboxypeptidase-like regulatory domain-containing protein n=1 Tax=Asprobacillus argus TaxID=3076534 RepID=A0ABU3LDT7_9FLAO|nr:carboxypeptidase-like regulatory domain-containing protein [Flavobacteriaceae bacterium S356]
MRKLLIYSFILFSVGVFSQTDSLKVKTVKGQVVDALSKKALSAAHILNLNSVVGTITNDTGLFDISAKANDTIIVSYLGYSSIKIKITNDLLKGNELLIELYEKAEEVKEVIIKSTKLIGVLEIDVKQVPKDRFTRIRINGLPQTYEVGKPKGRNFRSPIAALFQPVDFLYSHFGKKPKQLKKLQKIKKEDNLRKIMAGKFDREVMMEYLEMDRQELMELIADCNYSDYFTKKASDLQMIEAILDCYENYKALKKGKIERSRLPERKKEKG